MRDGNGMAGNIRKGRTPVRHKPVPVRSNTAAPHTPDTVAHIHRKHKIVDAPTQFPLPKKPKIHPAPQSPAPLSQ